jgi:hypothetical protein
MSDGRFSSLKSFLIQAAAGVVAAAVGALITVPDQKMELGVLALGLAAIPLFMLLGAAAVGLYGIFLAIKVLDLILTKLDFFDIDGS